MSKVFAPGYQHDGQYVSFPGRDTARRRELFPDAVFDHPAKANMYLVEELVKYLTEPGDTVLDPFGGTGTLLLGLQMDRNVVLIDVEEQYIRIMQETIKDWRGRGLIPEGRKVYVFLGDSRQVIKALPFLVDAVIFSPPYANILSTGRDVREGERLTVEAFQAYGGKSASSLNLGRLNPFLFERSMKTVYEALYRRMVDGGRIAVLTKDAMRGGKRLFISDGTIRQTQRAGFVLDNWFKWKQPLSSYRAPATAKGLVTVDEEDILIFRKEG